MSASQEYLKQIQQLAKDGRYQEIQALSQAALLSRFRQGPQLQSFDQNQYPPGLSHVSNGQDEQDEPIQDQVTRPC